MTKVVDPLWAARPTCHEDGCEAKVLRTEWAWHTDEDGKPQVIVKMVCQNRHRVVVEPLP